MGNKGQESDMKKILNLSIWAGVVILALVAGGYLLLSQIKPQGTEAWEKVLFGLPLQPPSALAFIALEQGLFAQEGLDVIVKEYPSGKRAMEGLFSGEVAIATTADIPVAFACFERRDIGIAASIGAADNIMNIIARKDRGIQSPGDLRGKRIATQKGSAGHFFLHLFLIKNGLSEKDVKMSFKKVEDLPGALARGEIDAFSLRDPQVSIAKASLGDNAVVFSEDQLYHWTEMLVSSNSIIKDSPQIITKMLKALMKAEAFAKKQPDRAIEIVSKKLGIDKSELAAFWPGFDLRISLDQSLLINLEDEARWILKYKLTDQTKVPNYFNFIYLNGMESVNKERVSVVR